MVPTPIDLRWFAQRDSFTIRQHWFPAISVSETHMFRFGIILVVIGGFLGYEGFKEFRVGQGAGSEPVGVDLADLEGGADPPGPYIRIEATDPPAIPHYDELVYEAEVASGETQPSAFSKLTHCYYPIISPEHPDYDALVNYYASADITMFPPTVSNYRVLVKTHRFKTFGEMQTGLGTITASVEGLVINKINSLSDDELNLLKQSFPSFDPDQVLILEEGRTPSSAGKWAGLLGGGALLALIGLFMILKPLLAKRAANNPSTPVVDET